MHRNRLMSVIICVCGSFLFSPQALAVEAQNKTPKIYLGEKRFDDSQDKLPPNYKGHDFAATLDLLFKEFSRIKAKDDFETEDLYKSKREKHGDLIKTQIGVNSEMLLAFVGGFDMSYKPEKGSFEYSFELNFYNESYFSENRFLGDIDAPLDVWKVSLIL